ncbi:hypothetical protein HD806DRAFT_532351 [Xylariaceae sp. AK1471]|nr:hypothetical protein HD806DRAFT_532351 [Xylariaceae sp. AK1471]
MREGNLRADRILGGEKRSKPTNKPTNKAKASNKSTTSKPQKSQQQPQAQKPASLTQTEEEKEEKRRQQTLLDVFSTTFSDVLGAEDFAAQLQELKAALFNRDFEGAFTKREAALDVYAARWSPTRALCYGRILRGLDEHLKLLLDDGSARSNLESYSRSNKREEETKTETETETEIDDGFPASGDQDKNSIEAKTRNLELEEQETPSMTEKPEKQKRSEKEEKTQTQTLKVLAIGGAAAEIVAFADYISSRSTASVATTTGAEITLLDVGPWGSIVQRLHATLVPTIVSSSAFRSDFLQKDILSLSQEELAGLLRSEDAAGGEEEEAQPPQNPVLITLLFTLNELYTAGGIKHTTSFLRALTAVVPPGSLLLVVDSPGSYSEAAVGKEAKRYPMQWLLDHTLVPNPRQKPTNSSQEDGRAGKTREGVAGGQGSSGGRECKWEKIESHDSVWFRVAEGLRYPIALENMRYQMHLYRASTS